VHVNYKVLKSTVRQTQIFVFKKKVLDSIFKAQKPILKILRCL